MYKLCVLFVLIFCTIHGLYADVDNDAGWEVATEEYSYYYNQVGETINELTIKEYCNSNTTVVCKHNCSRSPDCGNTFETFRVGNSIVAHC